MTLMVLGNILVIAATIPAVLFVLFYLRVRWEQSSIGRQTMAISVSMALILVNSTLIVLFKNYPGRGVIRIVLFATIIPALWWRVILIIRAQRNVRYNERYQGREVNHD
jgi:hypothetical protein